MINQFKFNYNLFAKTFAILMSVADKNKLKVYMLIKNFNRYCNLN